MPRATVCGQFGTFQDFSVKGRRRRSARLGSGRELRGYWLGLGHEGAGPFVGLIRPGSGPLSTLRTSRDAGGPALLFMRGHAGTARCGNAG